MLKFIAGIVVFLAAFFVIGCGGPDSGEVFGKQYEPSRTWVSTYPVAAGQSCYGTGTSRYCTTNYIYVPYTNYDDEDWKLHIRDDKGDEGWVYVDQTTYHETKIGDWYGDQDDEKIVDSDRGNSKERCNDC
jgi:hypothetical protein